MSVVVSSDIDKSRICTYGCVYLAYLTVMHLGLNVVITLWSSHAKLTFVGGTVHHSG